MKETQKKCSSCGVKGAEMKWSHEFGWDDLCGPCYRQRETGFATDNGKNEQAPAGFTYPPDTPLKAAIRKAFDNPTRANIEAVAEAARAERETR